MQIMQNVSNVVWQDLAAAIDSGFDYCVIIDC